MAIAIAAAMTGKNYAEACEHSPRAVVCYETEAGSPSALNVTIDELLGLKPPKAAPVEDDSEARRQWKRSRRIATLPERDQKAALPLKNSLVAETSLRKNGSASAGEHRHGR